MEIIMFVGMCIGIYYVLFTDPEDVYHDRELLRRYGTTDKDKIRERRKKRNENGAAKINQINQDERSPLYKSTSTETLDKLYEQTLVSNKESKKVSV